jgi:hypothetical protein
MSPEGNSSGLRGLALERRLPEGLRGLALERRLPEGLPGLAPVLSSTLRLQVLPYPTARALPAAGQPFSDDV